MAVFHNEFQQNQPNSLKDTREYSFIALYELGFIMGQYGWKSELSDKFWIKIVWNFSITCDTFYGI